MDLTRKIEGTRHVGSEFLTWLAFRSVTSDGILDTSLGQVELWFEDSVTLVSPYAGSEMNILKGESPAQGPEALLALRKGKQLETAKVSINYQGKRWEFQLSGPTLGLSGLKVPAVLGENPYESVIERFDLLATIEQIIRSLYDEFLTLRLDEKRWAKEVGRVEGWLGEQASPQG
jgi:hypothetical protein